MLEAGFRGKKPSHVPGGQGLGWAGGTCRGLYSPRHSPTHPPQGYFFPRGIFPAQGTADSAWPGVGLPAGTTPVQTQL